ncbi:MAG: molybdenum cofactor biosynthesis protein MoaE [Rhodospirillaceae bacterium]|nr:molybdenum cofactor biosynthesis protein MoaE [Rhodospirillaceae bacterium]
MTDAPSIRIQRESFDAGAELTAFSANHRGAGAICSFVGQMRDFRGADRASGQAIDAMELEHYPGMAERQLAELAAEARRRWPITGLAIVHRHGRLAPGEPIVFVATAGAHRAEAFAACEFLMDWLKTQAPFWKKETGPQGAESGAGWVTAEAADDARAARWSK